MANILDYLYWRGDLDFSASPFNEVDAAILTMISYLNLAGIVPEDETGAGVSMFEASDRYFSRLAPTGSRFKILSKISSTFDPVFNSNLEEMLKKLTTCPRYRDIRLSGFVEDTDFQVGRQFAAVTFTLPGSQPENVVAFRGTDNTLVGWKEDFELVYMEQTPAQESACKYLEQALRKLPGQFLVCGHSKGGNLALYAGSQIDAAGQERISRIINFDGPGFDFSLVDRAPFALCSHKILNFVPEESMVGMLLDPVGNRTVISSSARYAGQHNAFHWQVERTEFIRGTLADVAKLLDRILKTWLTEIPLAERKAFLETIFDLLGASEGTLIPSDPLKNFMEIKKVLRKYSQMDQETRLLLNQVFGALSNETKRAVSTTLKQKLPGI